MSCWEKSIILSYIQSVTNGPEANNQSSAEISINFRIEWLVSVADSTIHHVQSFPVHLINFIPSSHGVFHLPGPLDVW